MLKKGVKQLLKRTAILKWWLIIVIISLGITACAMAGVFEMVNKADVTKLSFVIFGLFVLTSAQTGMLTYKAEKVVTKREYDIIYRKNGTGWFVSDALFSLGMIGTVIGFIYMLGMSFSSITAANTASMQFALSKMGSGMSTALYTTAAGLICSLLLKLQLFNLEQYMEELEPATCECKKDSGDKGE